MNKNVMAKTEEEAKGKANIKTVKMTRLEEDAQGGPITADVHPDEVGNYEKAGWRKIK